MQVFSSRCRGRRAMLVFGTSYSDVQKQVGFYSFFFCEKGFYSLMYSSTRDGCGGEFSLSN